MSCLSEGPSAQHTKLRGVALNEVLSALWTTFTALGAPHGQDDTFSVRVMLLSVYDEMLRGVSQETQWPSYFYLTCQLGKCPLN